MPRIADPSPTAIADAAARLQRGEVVAMPTETVYGLAADTFNTEALAQVYRLKNRPAENPLIAHVLNASQANVLSGAWDDRCTRLADHFWPGPLTLVVPRSQAVPSQATAGYDTIAIRSPMHPVARSLLSAFGGPLSAPSANRSGHVSPTTAAHVAADFDDEPSLVILDGGACEVGIESTVLDLTRSPATVLRPGSVSAEAIGRVLGERVETAQGTTQQASPGTAASHYAPRTPVQLLSAKAIGQQLDEAESSVVALLQSSAPQQDERVIAMPGRPQAYAEQLYSAMREADGRNATVMLIEWPTDEGELWDAIRNRLSRAAAPRAG